MLDGHDLGLHGPILTRVSVSQQNFLRSNGAKVIGSPEKRSVAALDAKDFTRVAQGNDDLLEAISIQIARKDRRGGLEVDLLQREQFLGNV